MNLNEYAAQCHEDNYKWWLDLDCPCTFCGGSGTVNQLGPSGGVYLDSCNRCNGYGFMYNPDRNVGEMLMLCVSELAEAMESHRKGNALDDKIPTRSGFELELVDCIIRIFDLAGANDLDLEGAYQLKRAYNAKRKDHTIEARQQVGGKRY